MNVVFAALFGATLILVAAWLVWELWNAVEPKPITDDFLKLLDDSFGRDWRNPFTWPWARLSWAYGFTLIGVTSTIGVGVVIWTLVSSPEPAKAERETPELPTELELDSVWASRRRSAPQLPPFGGLLSDITTNRASV
jgi:hypothetical protein